MSAVGTPPGRATEASAVLGTDEAVLRLAVWDLTDDVVLPSPTTPGAAADLVQRVRVERLTGPLLAAVDAGALELGEEADAALVEAQEQALLWCVHLEARLLEVLSWLGVEAGIRPLVLKGSAVAHLDEVDPARRAFADLDLLVAGDELDGAVKVLTGHGGTRPHAERRPGYDRRFAKSVTVTLPDGVQVDVHRTLCDGAHGVRIPVDRLFEAAETFSLAGATVGCLSRPHRALHACYHAMLGSPAPRLVSRRDIAGYLLRADLDRDEVVDEADRWGGRPVLVQAVRTTLAELPIESERWSTWVATQRPSVREVAVLERQRVEGSALGRARFDQVREMALRDRIAFAFALAVPCRAHLRSRGRSRTGGYRRAVDRLRRRSTGLDEGSPSAPHHAR